MNQQLAAARGALDAAMVPWIEAQERLAKLHRRTDRLALSVIEDLAGDALDDLAKARADAASADAKVRALIRMLRELGSEWQSRGEPESARTYFREAELLTGKFDGLKPAAPTTAQIENQIPNWRGLFNQLGAGNAAAKIENADD